MLGHATNIRLERHALGDPLSAPGLGAALTRELGTKWFVWDACVSGKRRVDLHPLVLSPMCWARAEETAVRAAALVGQMGDLAAEDAEERARYRFDADVELLAAASRAACDTTSLVRVDLLVSTSGDLVACEVNADCPGGHNEVMALPRLARASGFSRGRDPSTVVLELAEELVALSGGFGSPRGLVALVHATGYAEDLQVCALLERMIVDRGGRAKRVSPTALRPGDGDTLEVGGRRVGVLYRFYPVEYMAGQGNVRAIAAAVRARNVSVVSSFASSHAQSKLAMARAFEHALTEAAAVFPSSSALSEITDAELLGSQGAWVVKRDLSRVGDHVLVGASMSPEDFADALADVRTAEREDGEVWIAQRFVPQVPVATPWGPEWLTLGVYVLRGRACGAFARVTPLLTCSHDARVVPVFVDEASG